MFVGAFWPVIVWSLLRLVGYACIGLTNGHGRQFVNSTFFQWSDRMGVDLYQLLDRARSIDLFIGNVCIK